MRIQRHPSLVETMVQLKDGSVYGKRWLYYRVALSLDVDTTNTVEPTQTGEIRSNAALEGFFNIFRGASKDVSPKMAAAQDKIRNKASQLIDTLNEFSQDIENAYRDRESDMSTINKNLQAKIDKEQDDVRKKELLTKLQVLQFLAIQIMI